MREYLLSTGEKVVKKDGIYYLKGGKVALRDREMYEYLLLNSSKLEDPRTFPESIRDKAEYDWRQGN